MIIRKVTRAYLTGKPCWISHIRPYDSIHMYRPGEEVDVLIFENCFPDETFANVSTRIVLDLCAMPTSEIGVEAMAMSRLIVTHEQGLADRLEDASGKPVHLLEHASINDLTYNPPRTEACHCAFLNFWPYASPINEADEVARQGAIVHEVADVLSAHFVKTLLPVEDCAESRRSLETLLKCSEMSYGHHLLRNQLMREQTEDEPVADRLERLLRG